MNPALSIAHTAIAAIDRSLPARVRQGLLGFSAPHDPHAPHDSCVVAAMGKAAPLMAKAALEFLGLPSARVIVVTADGVDLRGLARDPRVTVLHAAHPVPDARSVHAANALLDAASRARSLVVLVSGGSSSLVCAPCEGLTLDDKAALISALLDAGAPITDVNVVRRHLSRIKGGGLARAALPGPIRVVIVSDVLRDDGSEAPWDVGSGPAVPDPSTVEDARAALARWAPEWVPRVSHLLSTTLPATQPNLWATSIESSIVASPRDLADAAIEAAHAAGFEAILDEPSLASVDDLAREYVERARSLPRGVARIRVAEPSVVLPAHGAPRGRGGRAGRLALAAWAAGLPRDVSLACVASDGVDGSSGGAGGAVIGAIENEQESAQDALARFDDASFLARYHAAVLSGPSGINLLDLHVLCRARRG